jgi:hypothetical protein
MDRFLLAENPMIDADKRRVYIFHTQQPPMLIEVHHEACAFGDGELYMTGNYLNSDDLIETITLSVAALLICEPEVSEELKKKVNKVLNKAWHWYVAYLKWEDEQIDEMEDDL